MAKRTLPRPPRTVCALWEIHSEVKLTITKRAKGTGCDRHTAYATPQTFEYDTQPDSCYGLLRILSLGWLR